MSYHYVLYEILTTFATFTNEFFLFFLLLFSSPAACLHLQTVSFYQTLLLTSKTPSFTLLFHLFTRPLPPPRSPPVEISNFHLPRLCIPPEGRLNSFPISSRSLLAFSHSTRSFLFCLSLARQLTQKRQTRSDTHSPVICQHCQLRWKETSPPTCLPTAHFFMSDPTTAESAVPRYHL